MAKKKLISIHCFDKEIGLLGFDENRGGSSFQYNEDFLNIGQYQRMFPLIFKRMKQTQVFNKFNNETFRGLPPMIADSLPDLFGNLIFKTWIESTNRNMKDISVLEQLVYVGITGMGALEYQPSKSIAADDKINIEEIADVVKLILDQKKGIREAKMDHAALVNIFKIGSSAGGIRPKILVSENKKNGNIIPGDIIVAGDYNHYLIKLGIDDEARYSKELVEYCYYLTARKAGIEMMESKVIGGKHFATLRFDRQNAKKKHVLTATGITGLDFKDPSVSTYENLFELLLYLKCPHKDTEELFRRMVFNLVFANHDDHLKNQSFIYDESLDKWNLAPAYDLTYSLNREMNFKTTPRALSINGKRKGIELADLQIIAQKYTVKNFRRTVLEVQETKGFWETKALDLGIPERIVQAMKKNFQQF